MWVVGPRSESSSHSPLDLKSCNTGFGTDVPHQVLKVDFLRGVRPHLLVIVLCVLVIPHSHKLLVFVGSREDEGGDTQDVVWRDFGMVRCGSLEFERVDAGGDGADKAVVEFLIQVLVAWRRDVYELPFEICGRGRLEMRFERVGWVTIFESSYAFESNAKAVDV